MTALPSAKATALRFRIWQYAAPREWNVTVKEIAEALDVSAQRVSATLQAAGWLHRVRVERPDRGTSRWRADAAMSMGGNWLEEARPILSGVLEGRINSEFTA